jgi:hypothetical protein
MRSYWSSAGWQLPQPSQLPVRVIFALAGMGAKRHQSDASRLSEYVHEVADSTSDQHNASALGNIPDYTLFTRRRNVKIVRASAQPKTRLAIKTILRNTSGVKRRIVAMGV